MTYARWYAYLLAFKPAHRWLMTIAVFSVISIFWACFIFLPLRNAYQQHKQELTQLHKDRQTCLVQQRYCNRLHKDKKALQDEVDIGCNNKPACLQHHLAALVAEVEQAGLVLKGLKQQNIEHKQWYASAQVLCTMSGDSSTINNFFYNMQVPLVQCERLKWEKEIDGTVTVQSVFKCFMPNKSLENKSPSTLKKAEGLGG